MRNDRSWDILKETVDGTLEDYRSWMAEL